MARAIVKQLSDGKALATGLTVPDATDILWTLNHPTIWHLTVRARGWSPKRYERWLGDVLCTQLLGRSGESPDGDVVFFQTPGMIVALWGRDKLAEDSAVTDTGGWGGVTLAHIVGSPDEVDAVLADAEAAGATIGRPGGATFWGGYSGVFGDPDGHPWEVAHNPGWVLAEDGSVRLR